MRKRKSNATVDPHYISGPDKYDPVKESAKSFARAVIEDHPMMKQMRDEMTQKVHKMGRELMDGIRKKGKR